MDWHRRNLTHFQDDLKQLKGSRPVKPVTILESYHFQAMPDVVLDSRELEGDELEDWLKMDTPTVHGANPVAGLRLILSPRTEDSNRVLHRLPFSIDTFKIACEDFGLHHSFVRTIIRAKSAFYSTSFPHKKHQRQMSGYIIRNVETGGEDIILSTAMDQETKIQSAIIHGCTTRDIELLTEWLQILKSNIFHPLVLPALVLDLIRTKHARLIEDKYRLLVELSGTADQYETLIDDENPLDQVNNYNQTIKSTLQLHQDIGDFGIAAAQTRKQVYRLVELVKTDPPFCPVAQNTNYTTGLKEQLEDILDVYDDLERICDQIYNLIAQRQNEVNINIARDSRRIAASAKRDSSVMKAIAVVTMTLLPGTFVASFFAMPLLNWPAGLSEEQLDQVISPRFKYYWAVTIPLTMLVLAIWAVWANATSRADAVEE